MREHQLVQKDNCFNCSVCEWMWHRHPREDCPGVKRYSYGTVPDHLVTFTELRRRKLKPGGPPVGAYRRMRSPYNYLYFYDLNAAQLRRAPTEKQREAIAKMRAALVTRHTCERCHLYDHTHGRSLVRVVSLRIEGKEKRYCTWCRNTLIWERDRQALEQALKELLESDVPLLIVDTETTGLPYHEHFQVVEVAAVDRSGSAVFHSLVKPDIPMPEEASAVHGITDDMLADAPPFADIWPRLAQLLGAHEIYCYNAAFDREAILSTAAHYHLEIPELVEDEERWHCMMLEYARYHGAYSDYHKGWKWHSLGTACYVLNVEGGASHRALGDALNCLGVMRKLAERSGTHQVPEAMPFE